MPNRVVAYQLQCIPTAPEAPSCIKDPFRCDQLTQGVVDPCVPRNPRTAFNSNCRLPITVTPWDPYGHCISNQCSEAPLPAPKPPASPKPANP
jgi:hypothetical protein